MSREIEMDLYHVCVCMYFLVCYFLTLTLFNLKKSKNMHMYTHIQRLHGFFMSTEINQYNTAVGDFLKQSRPFSYVHANEQTNY